MLPIIAQYMHDCTDISLPMGRTLRIALALTHYRSASGLGLRFDAGEDGEFGSNNNLQFNVVFRNKQGGLSGKSNNASNFRNTGTDNQGGIDAESASFSFTSGAPDMKINHCYPANCEGTRDGVTVPAFTNRNSVTRGNVGIVQPGTPGGLLNPYASPLSHTVSFCANRKVSARIVAVAICSFPPKLM